MTVRSQSGSMFVSQFLDQKTTAHKPDQVSKAAVPPRNNLKNSVLLNETNKTEE